jgi:hypothetical protein
MPQAVSNLVKLGLVRESTPGTTPTSPTWLPMRFTGASLAGKPETVISEEIESSRMVSDLILVGINADGTLNWESSYFRGGYGGLDLLLEGAIANPFVRTAEKDNTLTAASISAVSATAYTTTAVSPAWAQDMLVYATGFADSGNNRTFKAAASSTSTSLTMTGGTVDASPATSARLKQIGFQARSAADVQATTTSGSALTSTSTDFTTFGLAVGQWVLLGTNAARLGGTDNYSFALTTANNGWCRVSAITSTRLSFDRTPAGFAADVATGKTIRVYFGDYVRNGTTVYTFSVEQQHPDLTTPAYQYITGGVVDTFDLTMASKAIVKGTSGIKAMGASVTTTRVSGSSNGTAETYGVMNSSSNVARIAENGTALSSPVYGLELVYNINNNARQLPAIGQIGFVGVNFGRQIVSGSAKFYFGDTTILAKAINNTATSLDWVIQSATGEVYQFEVPSVKLATAQAVPSAINVDITVDLTWQGIKYTNPAGATYQTQVMRCEQAGSAA